MTRVTLCVDALEPQPGGIGRYTWELCRGEAPADLDIHYYARNRLLPDPGVLIRGEVLPPAPTRLGRWWQRRALRGSLVHGPNYFLPAFADTGIITVHDLSVFRFPETHPAERVAAFERDFQSSLRRAAHIITDTETVREEVMDAFGVAPEQITAVRLGVDRRFRPHVPGTEDFLAKVGLTRGGYGLCVSTIEPRKKIAELLAAWRRLPRSLLDRHPLVICGGAGWRNESLRDEIAQGVKEGWVRHLGFVPEARLPELYANAALFVYPSIYEGFGLPPLEAMASGVPTVVSDRSCLPEVCGNAPLYIDPDDADAFAASLVRGLEDPSWRRQAVERGLERAAQFSWQGCVDATHDVYRKVAATL